MTRNKKLSRTLLKSLALSASAALGLALAPGCAVEEVGSDAVEFTLPSGQSVSAVPWARFKQDHPAEAASETGAGMEVQGGVLRYYATVGKFAFLTPEERLAASENVAYGCPANCGSLCCEFDGAYSGCGSGDWDGWCECSPGGCAGRPFTVDGVARTANVEFGDGWASA